MQKNPNIFPTFFFILFISLIIFGLSLWGELNTVSAFFERGTSKAQSSSLGFFQKLPFFSKNTELQKLKEENLNLISKLSKQEFLEKENSALSDQFKTSNPRSFDLLKAKVLGAPGFIPQVTAPVYLILDKGSKDGVKRGQAVVVKDNLVGKIVKVSSYLSKVDLVGSSSLSFAAKTDKGALGVIKGDGDGKMTLDNVLLSENISISDIVLTRGDIEFSGLGMTADLIVGNIQSIEKNPSALFQKGKVASFLSLNKLEIVFIVMPASPASPRGGL